MAITQKGWRDQLMMSLFTKETTYDAGVTMNDTNASSMTGFELDSSWPDRIENDKAEVTSLELGSDQQIVNQAVQLTYREPRARPHSVAGLAAMAFGQVTSFQEPTFPSYRHHSEPLAVGSSYPSMQVEHQKGGVQRAYTGCTVNSLTLSGEEGSPLSLEAEIIGSGARASSATAFASKIVESYMMLTNCKVWMESGADITITSPGTQDTEDISSTTPAALDARMKSFSFKWMNNMEGQHGFGGGGTYQDMDVGRRAAELTFSMLFVDATELDHFLNQDPLAVEFDLAGAVIPGGGTYQYGVNIIVPRFKLKSPAIAEGGAGDVLTLTMDCEVFNDGTNPAAFIETYNAQTAYIA